MARKKKLRASGPVSFKDLGSAPSTSTMSRLATTVKVGLPAMINAGADAVVVKPATAVSQFAQRLLPKGLQKSSAAKKVGKLAREGGLAPAAKRRRVRRSRLPWVIAVLVALCAGGAYYTYQKVTVPSLGVAKYLDYEKWLHNVSGGAFVADAKRSSHKPTSSSLSSADHKQRKMDRSRPKLNSGGKAKKDHAKKKISGSSSKSKGQVIRSRGAAANVRAER